MRVARNPAWPKDPDVRRRNEAVSTAGQKARLQGAAETMVEEGRPLRPNELNVGDRACRAPAASRILTQSARPLPPSALGGKGLMDLFSSKSDKPGNREFTNEPPRASLTDPPIGYQTPSARAAVCAWAGEDEPPEAAVPVGPGVGA